MTRKRVLCAYSMKEWIIFNRFKIFFDGYRITLYKRMLTNLKGGVNG